MPSKAASEKSPENPNAGHRARLRQKLLERGADALADYELLELILTISIPRRDVKPLAKALLKEFGNLAGLINAPKEKLEAAKGLGETTIAVLKTIQAATVRVTQDQVFDKPVLSSWEALLNYLKASLAFQEREFFKVLFLDQKNVLIAEETIGEGTINHAPVYPREIMRLAMQHGATAVILCHNHPSGDPKPSRQDISITREIIDVGRKLSVRVHDHVIIGKKGYASLRNLGLID